MPKESPTEFQALVAGRYRLLQPLGSGGFGDTFLARDEQLPSGRQVVVKRLRPIQDDEPTRQTVETAFLREASVLEDVGRGHAQIPELFAYFQEEGAFWLVQEYIPGPTLQSLGRIDSRQAIRLLQELLPVLEHLHDRGILHRDIKPDNIILRQSDGKPVLIDFGAVRESMAAVQLPSGSIRSTVVIGTQGFMAPEQAAGRPIFSSDLYALALTVISMLTGQNPQELPADPATGLLQWHTVAAETDPVLVTILDRALQAVPALRYPNARGMLAALSPSYSQSEPTQPTIIVAPVAPSQPSLSSPDYGTIIVAPRGPTEPATTDTADNTVVVAPVRANEPAGSATAPTMVTTPSGVPLPATDPPVSPPQTELTRVITTADATTSLRTPVETGPRHSVIPRTLLGIGLTAVTGTGLAMLLGRSDLRCRLLNTCTNEVAALLQTPLNAGGKDAALVPLTQRLKQASSIRQLTAAIQSVRQVQDRLASPQKAALTPILNQAQERLVAESRAQVIVDRARQQLDAFARSGSAPTGREQLQQLQQQLAAVSRQRFAYPQAQQILQQLATMSAAPAPNTNPVPAAEPRRQPAPAAPAGATQPSTSHPGTDGPLWGESQPQPNSPSGSLW